MRIENIIGMWVYTDDGDRISVHDIDGKPRVGAELIGSSDGYYEVLASATDSDCVGGVCPIK